MNELVRSVFGLIVRVGLLVAGLVFFLSLMAAASPAGETVTEAGA